MDWSEPKPIDVDTRMNSLDWRAMLSAGIRVPLTKEDTDIFDERMWGKCRYIDIYNARDATVMLVLTRIAKKGIKPVARPLASHLGH